jgi:hypothetical protein
MTTAPSSSSSSQLKSAQPSLTAPALPPPAIGRLLIPADQPLPPAQRLVVLVPNTDVDEVELAHRIWSLASPRGLDVLFLSLIGEAQAELQARRRLATLAAVTRDDWTRIETRFEMSRNWLEAVEHVWQRGDLIVCHAEQMIPKWGLGRQALAPAIVSCLNLPTYILSGFYPKLPTDRPNRFARVLLGVPPLLLLVGFFALQVQIDRQTQGWLSIVLLSLSVCVELGLFLAWHRWMN